ncbi:solute carrier family 46 member 3-like isoform X1 [Maniola jurtina]|uniref:solute carrier family 46 member 3-like isoform X1 n=1 Tax=Maniola jurtina TaxID=191418 RepID=UPI001E68B84F|nr:solute carrier family 46 member 3-like isoform X1 [Maniola jurtina]
MALEKINNMHEKEIKSSIEKDASETINNKNSNAEYSERDPLREDVEKSEDAMKKTYKETCCHMLRNITVEPAMFLYIIPAILTALTLQNLNIEKACRVNLNFSSEICDALRKQTLGEQNEYERAVQKLVAKALSWKTNITGTVPCLLALFIGSWSDMTGHRKSFIMLPVIGQFILCLNGIINTYFFTQLNLEVLVFTDAIIDGLSGSWCVCLMALFAYISDVTNDDNRTFRMGLVSFSLTVGFPIGMGISGIFLKKFGFYGCYGVAGCLHFINLMYTIFILKDPKRSAEQKMHDKKGVLYFFRTFFDVRNVKETLTVVFKNGPNNRRFRICTMLVVVSILFGPMHGEISVMYISTRYRFNWDEVKFSVFQAYNFVTHTIGTIFSITVFSKYLKWHDSVLGIISTLSKIAASFVYCFAPNERIFFIAPLVDILNGTSLLAMRSIVSKLVLPSEFGKVNSIFALTENLMPLVYVPLYTQVYVATMEVLPGAVFLMGAAMTLPAVVVFIWLFWEHRRNLRRSKKQNGVELKEM